MERDTKSQSPKFNLEHRRRGREPSEILTKHNMTDTIKGIKNGDDCSRSHDLTGSLCAPWELMLSNVAKFQKSLREAQDKQELDELHRQAQQGCKVFNEIMNRSTENSQDDS